MVNVMVLDAACRILEPKGNLEEGASLKSSSLESPFIFMSSVWWIDGMLHMEDDSTQHLSEVVAQPELEGRNTHLRQEPSPEHNRHYLLEETPTEDTVTLTYDVEQTKEPNKWDCNEEINDRLSEEPCQYSLPSLHGFILFLGEQNGLRQIKPIQISKMLVVVVVAIPPSVVGVVLVDAQQLTHEDVHLKRSEEVAVGQVVELHEDAESVPPVYEPSNEAKSQQGDAYP